MKLRSLLRKCLLPGLGVIGLFFIGMVIIAVSGLRDHIGKGDIGLVLGNKAELDGTPSPRLRARLDRTVELYKAGWFPDVIASGGTGKEGYDESVVMRDYLVSHGVPAEHVLMDNAGITTFASARNTAEIMRRRNAGSVLVITQYFHVPRSRLALGRFGISPVYSAHAYFFEARDVYSLTRELFGYTGYLFRHYEAIPAQGDQ